MTYSKDLKPKGEGGTLYTSKDLAAIQAEINALKAATANLENQLADMADLTNTTVLRANAVQTHDISANLAVLGTAVVEGELAVSNGSGNDKDVIVNRNGVPEWGTPTDINAVNVLVTDTVERATTVDHTGTVNEADSVQNVDQCETVDEAQTVTQADKVAHADLVQVADVIQQTGDAQIVGDLDVTGSISQAGSTLDATYIPLAEKGVADGVATLDSSGRIPASQLTIDAMEYKGKWNASNNTPTLADGTGTDGDFYIVSVAGSQDLGSGNIDFYVNDRVLYNGSEWERVPAGQVDSVNGATGDVVLTGNDIKTSLTSQVTLREREQVHLYVQGQGASATKTVDGYYSLSGVCLITFDTNNVYQGALKLKINGNDYDVWINDAASSATNYTLPKGTYLMQLRINGLTPYAVIETNFESFIARYADHATSADSANAAQRDGASWVGCNTAAATQNKAITIPSTPSFDIGQSFICKFAYANTNTNAKIVINSTAFTPYLNGRLLSADNYDIKADYYRITKVSANTVILTPISNPIASVFDFVLSQNETFTGYGLKRGYINLNGLLIQWGYYHPDSYQGSAITTVTIPWLKTFSDVISLSANSELAGSDSNNCQIISWHNDRVDVKANYFAFVFVIAIGVA